jgi:dTDP-4-dehydrorhamnose 3,5-epimerase
MVDFRALSISGAWIYRSPVFADERGSFAEWFRRDHINNQLGRDFRVVQANTSLSKKGVIRGIHFSVAPEGQAKWVKCLSGEIWDVVVDLRPESPTFKQWESIRLSAKSGEAIVISEGLGHGFLATKDETVVSYLLSSYFSPEEEFTLDAFDEELAIKWPGESYQLSERDANAPGLSELAEILNKKRKTII